MYASVFCLSLYATFIDDPYLCINIIILGMTGMVDYTNYEDMQYAVSIENLSVF